MRRRFFIRHDHNASQSEVRYPSSRGTEGSPGVSLRVPETPGGPSSQAPLDNVFCWQRPMSLQFSSDNGLVSAFKYGFNNNIHE